MYNNKDVRDIVNKLPDGVITKFILNAGDLTMGAVSLLKEEKGVLQAEYLYKFNDEYDAKNFKSEIEGFLNSMDVYDVDIIQNRNYVEGSAKAYVRDWLDLLFGH